MLTVIPVAQVIAVKAPGFGERKSSYLEDIAIMTGAQVVKEELGLSLDKVRIKLFSLVVYFIVSCWVQGLEVWVCFLLISLFLNHLHAVRQ